MPKKPCAHPGCSRLLDVTRTYCDQHAKAEKQERGRFADAKRSDRPSRRWYNLAAWKGKNGRRTRQLRAEPLCTMCPDHSKQVATVADHVEPHREDHGKFWFGALQSLCKSCHDSKKQREERRTAIKGGGPEKVQSLPTEDRRG
ncbi:HNH endonuclease [uncultured Pelagimonas sp.]|uniref:HNH endonuclease n=1 Tax=uncultured Pelagimonas sp. TaxID=1618102 RepID=UPI00261D56C6|nr:HNH endonuclease [uncultured Pelagimonas sp.]